MKKWEISLLVAIFVTILCCAVLPEPTMQWWTAAFSPLCDGVLTANAGGGGVILRSKLWELVSKVVT